MYYGNLRDRQSFLPESAQVFVQIPTKLVGKFKNKKSSFRKNSTDLKIKFWQTSKKFPLKLQKWYEEIFLSKTSFPLNPILDTWKEVLTTLLKDFCQKTKHFLSALKKQYGSTSFRQKSVCIVWTLPWTRNRQFQKNCRKKAKLNVRKAFARPRNLDSKWNILLKKLFRVRSFICRCSMLFSQPSRVFLPAVCKMPAQKPNLLEETICAEKISFLKEWLRKSTR